MNLPDRVAFSIPGLNIDIYWYAILISLGIIAALIVASICAKRRYLPVDTAVDLCLVAVPLGIVFARLYYVLFNLEMYTSFADIINTRNGGLAIPGGIIGGFLGIFIYSLIKKRKVWEYLDVAAPAVVIAQAIGRWGNFINQEAYGTAVTDPKYMFFPFAVRIEDCTDVCDVMGQHGHLATFFYESMICLIIFVVLMLLFNKVKHKGDICLGYFLMYSFERAIVEQLRLDSLMLGKVRITQLVCVAVFIAVWAFIIVRAVLERKKSIIYCPLNLEDEKKRSIEEAKQELLEKQKKLDEGAADSADTDNEVDSEEGDTEATEATEATEKAEKAEAAAEKSESENNKDE